MANLSELKRPSWWAITLIAGFVQAVKPDLEDNNK